jgi:hypothetical protein
VALFVLQHLIIEPADMRSGSLVFSNLPYMTLSVAFIQMLKVCASVAKKWNWRNTEKSSC